MQNGSTVCWWSLSGLSQVLWVLPVYIKHVLNDLQKGPFHSGGLWNR